MAHNKSILAGLCSMTIGISNVFLVAGVMADNLGPDIDLPGGMVSSTTIAQTKSSYAEWLEQDVRANNKVLVSQQGINNQTVIHQSGSHHLAFSNQAGSNNSIDIIQAGTNETAILNQTGHNHKANIQQFGSNHFIHATQIGAATTLEIKQISTATKPLSVTLVHPGTTMKIIQ